MSKLAALIATTCVLALAGCGPDYDPLTRGGVYHVEHINRTNLVLSAAYPGDLVRGTGSPVNNGVLAAAAIDRLETNKVKKLPDAGLSDVHVTGQGSSSD
jgi:hypothetical protein